VIYILGDELPYFLGRWCQCDKTARRAVFVGQQEKKLEKSRFVSHLFTGSLAGIGKLPALAGLYICYGMYSICCTERFGGSSIL
jgi:hypothetical protein